MDSRASAAARRSPSPRVMQDAKDLERYVPIAAVIGIVSTVLLIFWGRW
jgi:hypothetical protein